MKLFISFPMLLFSGIALASLREGKRIYPEYANTTDEIDLTYFCGTSKLHVWKAKDAGQTMLTLRNSDGHIVDRRLIEGSMESSQCGDFLKIGEPTFYVEGWTGGAHCCADHVYYAVGNEPRLLLAFYQGDIREIEEPLYQDLNGDGIHEIILTEDNFMDLGGMCGTCESYLKVVFCYQNEVYAECTLNQEVWLEKEENDCLALIHEIYRQEPGEPPYLGPSGLAAAFFGYKALQGKEIEALATLKQSLPKVAYRHVQRLLPEIRKALSDRENLLKRTQHRMKTQYRQNQLDK
jgi:hypothetical protein